MPNWSNLAKAARWWGAIGSAGAASAARSAWASPYGKAAIIGAGVGGIYGAFSENTSVLGGMVKGAALGAGGRAAFGAGAAGLQRFRYGKLMGMGNGQAAWGAMQGLGRDARNLIGNTKSRAYNYIQSTLKV
jgi:hypothetical protein